MRRRAGPCSWRAACLAARGMSHSARQRIVTPGAHLNDHAGHCSIKRPGGGNEILPTLQALHFRRIRRLGREALAALGAAAGEDVAAANRRHAGAEAMAALADELGRLVGALHVRNSDLGFSANDTNNMTR